MRIPSNPVCAVVIACSWSLFASPSNGANFQLDSAASKHTISVLDFQSNGDMGSMGTEVAGVIGATIVELGRYQVVERSQMKSILAEQGFQESGVCGNSDCQVQVGKILGVDWIVTGSVGAIPGGFSTNLRLLEVGTGKVLYQKHDVYVGDVVTFLTKRVINLAEDIFRGKPERIDMDSLLELKEGDVKILSGKVVPSISSQVLRVKGVDGGIIFQQGAMQIKAMKPGASDFQVVAAADSSVGRIVHVTVFADEVMAKKRRAFRIRWLGSLASASLAVGGFASGYMSNVSLKKAQSEYDASTTLSGIQSARSKMDQRVMLRNLGYAAGAAGLLGIAGFQFAF